MISAKLNSAWSSWKYNLEGILEDNVLLCVCVCLCMRERERRVIRIICLVDKQMFGIIKRRSFKLQSRIIPLSLRTWVGGRQSEMWSSHWFIIPPGPWVKQVRGYLHDVKTVSLLSRCGQVNSPMIRVHFSQFFFKSRVWLAWLTTILSCHQRMPGTLNSD